MKILILAGSREQFENYLNDNGLTDSEAFYAYEPYVIRGQEFNKIEVIGTFWERPHANDLYEEAKRRLR
jgi:hypothetical protein